MHTGCLTGRGVLTAPKPPPEHIEEGRGPKTSALALAGLRSILADPSFVLLLTTYQPHEEAAADCWTACSHAVSFSGANSNSPAPNSHRETRKEG